MISFRLIKKAISRRVNNAFVCWFLTGFLVGSLLFPSSVFGSDKLKVVTGHLPPFVSENPKESYLIDVLHAVAELMVVEFEISFYPWKRCQFMVEKHIAWAALPYVITDNRRQKFLFSDPLYFSRVKFFYYDAKNNKTELKWSKLSDFILYRLVGTRGYYYIDHLKDAGLDLTLVNDEPQGLKMLHFGRVDFILLNETAGWHMIRNIYPPDVSSQFKALSRPYREVRSNLMTSKNYPEAHGLIARFNKALSQVKTSGVYQKIIDRYGLVVTY